MLGFCGLVAAQLTLICVCSYWISWDMQRKEKRPTFRRQVWIDLTRLFEKYRDRVRNSALSQAVAVKAVQVEPANGRQSGESPRLSGERAASRS